jgi:hypothetical protein
MFVTRLNLGDTFWNIGLHIKLNAVINFTWRDRAQRVLLFPLLVCTSGLGSAAPTSQSVEAGGRDNKDLTYHGTVEPAEQFNRNSFVMKDGSTITRRPEKEMLHRY